MNLKRMRALLNTEKDKENNPNRRIENKEVKANMETIHEDDNPAVLEGVSVDQEQPTTNGRNQLQAVYYIQAFLEGTGIKEAIRKEVQKEIRLLTGKCKIMDDELVQMHKGVLVRKVLITEVQRREVLEQTHEGMGHRGAFSVLRNLSSRYWFKPKERLIARHMSRCIEGQQYAASNRRTTPFYPLETNDVFAHWYIDFGGPLCRNNRYAIIAVGSITRWAEIILAKETTAELRTSYMSISFAGE